MERTMTRRIPSIIVPDEEEDSDLKARQPNDDGSGPRIKPRPGRLPDGLTARPESPLERDSGQKNDAQAGLDPRSTETRSRGRSAPQEIHRVSRSTSPHDSRSTYRRTSLILDDVRPARSPSPLSRSTSVYPARQQSWPIQNIDRLKSSGPGSLLARRIGGLGGQDQLLRFHKKPIHIPPTSASSVQGSMLPSPDLAAPGLSPMVLNNLHGIRHQQYPPSQPFSDQPDIRSCVATVELKPTSNSTKPTANKLSKDAWDNATFYLENGGQTTLTPVSSGEYLEEGLRGSVVTLNCPDDIKGAAMADDVKMWWLHVRGHPLRINLLEDLLISCPYIHDEAKGVALAFLSHILPTVEKRSSVGKYIEPGYVMRYDGRHPRSRYKKDTSVTFIAAPYLSFASGATTERQSEEDHITRTLLQSLYDYDLEDIRASRNLSWRQVFNNDKTLYAPQMWCLLVDSNVVITLGDIAVPNITGRLIGVNQYEPGARKTIFIVQPYHDHHSFDVHQGLSFAEFLQLVANSIQDHHSETEFELEDEDGRILTPSRWLNLLSSRKFSKATFIVVFKKKDDNGSKTNATTNEEWNIEARVSSGLDKTTGTVIGSLDRLNEDESTESLDTPERLHTANPTQAKQQETDFPGSNTLEMPRLDMSNLGHPSTSKLVLPTRPFFTWLQHPQGSQLDPGSPHIKLLQQVHSSLRNENELYKIGHQYKLGDLIRRHHCLSHITGEPERNSPSSTWKGPETAPSSPDASTSADVDDTHSSQTRWSSQFRPRKSSGRPSLASTKTSYHTMVPESTKPAMSTLLSNTNNMFLHLSLDKGLVSDVPGIESDVQDLSNHIRAMRSTLRVLYHVSTDLLSLFVPSEDYDDNTVVRKQLGCLDRIFKHTEFSLAMNDTDDHDQWLIRDFTAAISGERGQKLSKLEDKSFHNCESCRSGKAYESIEKALEHIHRHLEHKDDENRKTKYQLLEDPCLVWLVPKHSLRHDRWSQAVKGIVEQLLVALEQIHTQARELSLSVSFSKDGHDTLSDIAQELPGSLVQAFEMILSLHLVTAQRVFMAIGDNKRSRHSFLKSIRIPQNTSSSLLTSQFKGYKEKATNLFSKAQKDLLLFSSTTRHSGAVDLKPIGREFLVAAILSNLQNQVIEHGTCLNVLDLYQRRMLRLQYLVNARPQRRLFLEIKAVELELEALRNTFNYQSIMFQKYLLILDPLSFHVPDSDRFSQYSLERDYVEAQLRMLETRDTESYVLQRIARDLKSQVKQSIEILEEGHGKAIRVFTIVTLFFLPMSFFSSFMGMNTVDIRDTNRDQRFFWIVAIPMTAGVVALALIYGYKWDSIMDFVSTVWEVYRTRREGRREPAGLDIPGLLETHSYSTVSGSSTRSLVSTKGRGFELRLPEAVRSYFGRGRAYSGSKV